MRFTSICITLLFLSCVSSKKILTPFTGEVYVVEEFISNDSIHFMNLSDSILIIFDKKITNKNEIVTVNFLLKCIDSNQLNYLEPFDGWGGSLYFNKKERKYGLCFYDRIIDINLINSNDILKELWGSLKHANRLYDLIKTGDSIIIESNKNYSMMLKLIKVR